jgi:hypothetical protein
MDNFASGIIMAEVAVCAADWIIVPERWYGWSDLIYY